MAQGSLLLEHGAGQHSQGLMQAMDALNRRYGRYTVSVFASPAVKSWAMRRENMSPCYTTRWSGVPIVSSPPNALFIRWHFLTTSRIFLSVFIYR